MNVIGYDIGSGKDVTAIAVRRDGFQLVAEVPEGVEVLGMTVYCGAVYIATDAGLMQIVDGQLVPVLN